MASRCACQRQLEPPSGTTCSESVLADSGWTWSYCWSNSGQCGCALGLGWGRRGSKTMALQDEGEGGGGLLSHPGLGTPTARCGVWRRPPAWSAARFGVGDDNTYILGCTIRGGQGTQGQARRSVILGARVVTHRQRHPRPPLPLGPVHRNSPLYIARYMYVCVGRGRAPAGGGVGGPRAEYATCHPTLNSPHRAKCRTHCQFPPLRRRRIRPGPARLE